MAARDPIYSERFVTCTVAQVYVTFNVPLGKRAVIRCFNAVNAGGTTGVSSLIAGGAIVCEAHLLGATQTVYGDLRCVVYGGESISVINTAVGMHVSCHGYLFADPAGGKAPANEVSYELELDPLPAMLDAP